MSNVNVFIFFLLGALSFAFIAIRFAASSATAFRRFSIGLGLLALAFATWSVIIATHPSDITTLTTVGVIPFGLANLFFVLSATTIFDSKTRTVLVSVAVAVLGALFVLRTFITPSKPEINAGGYFSFNADPLAMLLYVVVFAGALMPAVQVVSTQIKNPKTAMFTRLFFNVVTLSGVVLLVSTNDELQNLNGYVLLAALIGLVVTHARKAPEALSN